MNAAAARLLDHLGEEFLHNGRHVTLLSVGADGRALVRPIGARENENVWADSLQYTSVRLRKASGPVPIATSRALMIAADHVPLAVELVSAFPTTEIDPLELVNAVRAAASQMTGGGLDRQAMLEIISLASLSLTARRPT